MASSESQPVADAPASESVAEETPAPEPAPEVEVPKEFTSALKKAEGYSKTLHMSKQGIYNQLTSDFDQFSPEAAQYAVDNMEADWKANALAKAKSYQDTLDMSPAAIRDQLTSEFEAFTDEEAQYAVDNL